MSVQFVNVTVNTFDLYQTSVRDYGTVAIVGVGNNNGTAPIKVGSYGEAETLFADTALGKGVKLALRNGAASVWAVDCGSATLTSVKTALAKLEQYDIQVVALAGIVETAENAFISDALLDHVNAAEIERIGIFQLAAGEDAVTMPTAIAGLKAGSESRIFGIAHNSTSDVACAIAGLVAGLKPSESPLLKAISGIVQTSGFTTTAMDGLKLAQINCLTNPTYLTGNAFVLATDYTMGADGLKYIDTRRVIDDITYKLKAGLTDPAIIGQAQITKAGLAIVLGRLSGIMQNCVNSGEIEEYKFNFPIVNALSKPASSRSDAENTLISTARGNRGIEGEVVVKYAGVLHQINIEVTMTV